MASSDAYMREKWRAANTKWQAEAKKLIQFAEGQKVELFKEYSMNMEKVDEKLVLLSQKRQQRNAKPGEKN